MNRIKTVTIDTTNLIGWRKEKAIEASSMVLKFFQSDYLYKQFMATDISSLRGESHNSISRKMENNTKALYELIMSGKESLEKEADFNIDLVITWYKKMWSKVKGYINIGSPVIYVNGKYFDNETRIKVGSNMAHEWLHTVGFYHTDTNGYLRESIPYLVNKWFEDFYTNPELQTNSDIVIINEKPKTETYCKRAWYFLWLKNVCYTRVVR